MALDNRFDINKQNQIQGTPTTTGSTSNVSENDSKSKAISFENNTKQDPVVETIKTEEFQNLPPEKQLEELKKKFPNVDEKELEQTIKTVKSTIEKEDSDVVFNFDINEIPEINKEEKLLNKYAIKIKKTNIDEVLAHLKSKDANTLTPEEQEILKYIEASKAQTKVVIPNEKLKTFIEKYGDEIDNLIPEEVLNSPKWQKKSPMQKMNARADAIISRLNPEYKNIINKKEIRNEFYDQIGEILDPDWNNWEDIKDIKNPILKDIALNERKMHKRQMLATILDALETSGKPISTILSTDPNTRAEIKEKYAGKLINVILSDKSIDVTKPSWNKKNEQEQINTYIDSVLETMNPRYKSLNEKNKTIKRQEFINKVAHEYFPDWDSLNDVEKAQRKKWLARQISAIKYSADTDGQVKSLDDFKKLDMKSQIKIIENYEKHHNIQLSPQEMIFRQTMIAKNTYKVTNADIIETIDKTLENPNLSPEDRAELEKFRKEKSEEIKISDNPNEATSVSVITTENEIETKYSGNIDAYLEDVAKSYDCENLEDLKNNKQALEYIFSSCHDYETRQALSKRLGLKYDKVPSSKYQRTEAIAQTMVNEDVEGYKQATDVAVANKENTIVNKSLKRVPAYIKKHDDRLDIAKHAVNQNPDFEKAIAESWNNLEIVTTEEAKALGHDFNMSDEVSNAVKAKFTESFIETAANDQIRLEYSQDFSQIDNSAVTEGLAAASHSVGEQYRNQYNSYVETAMNNYPPEQQQNIRSAMQTGEISKETLSQTTPPANDKVENRTTNSSNNENNQVPKDTASTSANKNNGSIETYQQESADSSINRTSVSDITISNNNTSTNAATAQIQDFTTQLKQQTVTEPTYSPSANAETSTKSNTTATTNKSISADQYNEINDNFTTEALQQKKEAVANNIQNYQENVEASTAEQENNISTENLQYIDKILQENTTPTDSEREKIRQIFKNVGTNITAIYNMVIDRYGSQAQDKFLEILATNGSSDSIRSFVNGMKNDPSVIKKLYTRCSNQKVKSELLNMLPINDIISMIQAGQIKISDLGTNNYKRVIAELKQSDPEKLNELFGEFENNIKDKISAGYSLNNSDRQKLYDYLANNIDGISNTKFSRFLQYLPIDAREELVALKNSPKTKQTSEPTEQNTAEEETSKISNTKQQTENTSGITNAKQEENKLQAKTEEPTTKVFKDFEMETVLNDGTKVKRKETFGAISNNTDMYDDYEEISQVSENPSMADPILTPGSYEWQVKYNRQMAYQPVTQPTNMPSEDEGLLMGSNKVSQRLQIDKMKKRGPFYFNA